MSVSNMKKLTVLSPSGEADALVRRLMRLKCVEIRTVDPGTVESDTAWIRNDCDTQRVEAERRVADVAAAIPVLAPYAPPVKGVGGRTIRIHGSAFEKTGSYSAAWSVVREVLAIKAGIAECQNEESRIAALRASLTPWLTYDAPLGESRTDRGEIWLGTLPSHVRLSDIAQGFRDVYAGAEEVSRDTDALYVAVMFLKEEEATVNRVLNGLGFLRCTFGGVVTTARVAYEEAAKQLAEAENRMQAYLDRLNELGVLIDDLKVLYDVETTSLYAAQNKAKMAATGSCVMLEGWVPAERDVKVAAVLDGLHCAYEMTEPEEGEEPPILLKNNGYASNFEWVVGMYAYPKYGTFDPTFIMSIFYFVIFGLMFADVGYGLLLLLAGFAAPKLLHMKPGMTRMLNMFGYCGIACVALGVVFGGWFGDLPYALLTNIIHAGEGYTLEMAKADYPFFNGVVLTLGGEPVSLNPLENPMAFLVVSLAMGAVHLVAGMAVKFSILWKKGDKVAAIFDIGSWWIVFAGIGLIFVNSTVGFIVAGVGVAMIVLMSGRANKNFILRILMGLKGLYDIVSYASDLLSYSRILALGLAAGVIAQVVNLMATMGGPTVVGFIMLVAVFLFGHTLNLAINLLGSFVHTSRLQYLEFFNKFYEDGGVPFEPSEPCQEYSTVEISDSSDWTEEQAISVGTSSVQ